MQKILLKTTSRKIEPELTELFLKNKIEAKFQDFSNPDEVAQNFDYCIIKINFNSDEEVELAKMFIKNNKHLKFCAYFENMNKNVLNKAYDLGCNKFCHDGESLKNILKSNEIKFHEKMTAFTKFKRQRVLLVDDIQINLDVLQDILLPFDFEVHSFTSSKAALKLANEMRFDLVFLDISMPELNGFEFAVRMKKSKNNSTTPIIFITGNVGAQSKIEGYTLGSIAYVEKPLEPETLRARVYGILETRALHSEIIEEKESFIQMLTHDLKTPITAQISVLKLLLKGKFGKLSDEQQELILEVLSSNDYMLTMVRNVLTKYQYENNSIEIIKSEQRIESNILQVLNEFRFALEKKKITTKITGDTNAVLIYDEIEIKRVLNNLISNAVEHSIENSEIEIELEKTKSRLLVRIINIGSGLLEEDISTIFNKYTSKAKKYRKVGFGLGLYICKEIIEAHHGNIEAKVEKIENSECAKRIIFEFTLPIEEITANNRTSLSNVNQ